MGVFPAASRFSLPTVYHKLMTEPESPIIDFYPVDFQIDMNGKKQAWLGVALLPFVEEKRLLDALRPCEEGLSQEEKERNTIGHEYFFVGKEHPFFKSMCELYKARDA